MPGQGTAAYIVRQEFQVRPVTINVVEGESRSRPLGVLGLLGNPDLAFQGLRSVVDDLIASGRFEVAPSASEGEVYLQLGGQEAPLALLRVREGGVDAAANTLCRVVARRSHDPARPVDVVILKLLVRDQDTEIANVATAGLAGIQATLPDGSEWSLTLSGSLAAYPWLTETAARHLGLAEGEIIPARSTATEITVTVIAGAGANDGSASYPIAPPAIAIGSETVHNVQPNNAVITKDGVAEHEPTSQEVIDSVIEQVRSVPDPLGRIALGDELSKTLMPAVYEQMMADAAEFREGGGTWREIGERLGVTPQGAQTRLDPTARERNAEKARRNRSTP
jgi:hypothetical protein